METQENNTATNPLNNSSENYEAFLDESLEEYLKISLQESWVLIAREIQGEILGRFSKGFSLHEVHRD